MTSLAGQKSTLNESLETPFDFGSHFLGGRDED